MRRIIRGIATVDGEMDPFTYEISEAYRRAYVSTMTPLVWGFDPLEDLSLPHPWSTRGLEEINIYPEYPLRVDVDAEDDTDVIDYVEKHARWSARANALRVARELDFYAELGRTYDIMISDRGSEVLYNRAQVGVDFEQESYEACVEIEAENSARRGRTHHRQFLTIVEVTDEEVEA